MNVLTAQQRLAQLQTLHRKIEKEITLLQDQLNNAPRKRRITAICGMDGGYRKHLRHQQTPCQPCKDAHAAVERRRQQRRKETP